MKKLRNKLNVALNYLEKGGSITLSSGHTLCIPDGYEEPGFLSTVYRHGKVIEENFVMQIGSDTAWSFLLDYVRKMTDEEMVKLIMVPKIKSGKVLDD